jgi:hypothetical protein
MITTTLAVLALAGGLSAGNAPSPAWQKDYAQALTVASSELKPVAVFIGQGKTPPSKMVADGTIPTDAAKLLSEKYVCVFIDTDTAVGKDMAGRFDLTEGLVISSPGGKVQALRHNGNVAGADLTGKLTQFATTGQPATTVTTGVSAGVIYAGGCANGSCGVIYQGGYSAPAYQTAPTYYYSAPFGSSCPNGRCPNQR